MASSRVDSHSSPALCNGALPRNVNHKALCSHDGIYDGEHTAVKEVAGRRSRSAV